MSDIFGKMDDKSRNAETTKPFVPGPAWRAAEAAGFDMSLIELNLAKTPLQRMRDHDRALAQVNLLRDAMRKHHGSR